MPSKKSAPNFVRLALALWLALLPVVVVAQAPGFRDDRILIIPKPGQEKALAKFHATQQGKVRRHFVAMGNVEVIELPRKSDIRSVIDRYQRSGLVEVAEPDSLWHVAAAPNDPFYADGTLWHLNNLAIPDADIAAPEAWDILNSASNVVVAVIDTGVNYTHNDIAANMWTHPGEIPGNGIDDDGNGVVDDVHGIAALGSSTTGIPDDGFGHGAHVAGILGAVGDNGTGVCGVAWRVQMMACKFIDNAGSGSTGDLIECLDYARTNGARVINCSFVGPGPYSIALSNSFNAVRNAGIVVVAAAGNSGVNNDLTPYYPASFRIDNMVSVAATTWNDDLWLASNYGATSVHLAAPGVDIYSTYIGANDSYAHNSGTSMAAPVVSAAAALLRAKFPDETPQQIITRLLAATDPLPGLAGKCITGGRFNLRKALDGSALPTYTIQPAAYDWVPTNGLSFISLTADGFSSAKTLPFPFHYFTSNYTRLYVGANGLIGFATPGLTIAMNTDLPSSTTPNGALFPYWDDLNPTAGGSVWFGTYGEAPNRKAVISWVGVPHNITTPPPLTPLTFQVILHESGHIAFQYQEVETGRNTLISGKTATIGLEDASGLFAAKYSFNGEPALLTNNQAILFTPSNAVHPAPALQALPLTVSGQFQLRLFAEPARSCVLLASTNLTHWEPVSTNRIPSSGVLVFTEAGVANTPHHFFRAALQP